jgi:UBX domain-containing protein 1
MSSQNDSDDEHDEETYFAGGERSSISVQNPGRGRGGGRGGGPGVDLVQDLRRKAQEEGASSGEAPAA